MSFYDFQLTIGELLASAVERNSDQLVTFRDRDHFTYSRFMGDVRRLAGGLSKLGVSRGDVVAVLDYDSIPYLQSYFAVPALGAVLHTVNIRYPSEVMYYTMQHARDKYAIIRDDFLPVAEKHAELFKFIKGWIVVSERDAKSSLPGSVSLNDIATVDDFEFPRIGENETATVFYTSGTTGKPKGVTFTHRQIVLHTLCGISSFSDPPISMTNQDVWMPLVPLFHVHSWGLPFSNLLKGMKHVMPGKYEIPELFRTIRNEKVTLMAMVPSVLYLMISHPDAPKYLSGLNIRVVVGGAALPKGLSEKAAQLGIQTFSGYGLSETAPVLTLATFNQAVLQMTEQERNGYRLKTGYPVPFVHLRITDSSGKDVPRDGKSIGEIVVRSPWLTKGYYMDEEKTAELWKDDWMHTGDLAVMDAHGYVQIVDREKDAVKSGGEFIPSLLLEDAISTCPGVAEVAVIGRKDDTWGERPIAFVVGKGDVTSADIVKSLSTLVESGRIAKFWIPDEFIFVNSLEKTSTGKIDKKALKAGLH